MVPQLLASRINPTQPQKEGCRDRFLLLPRTHVPSHSQEADRHTDPHSIWDNAPLVPRGINSATAGEGRPAAVSLPSSPSLPPCGQPTCCCLAAAIAAVAALITHLATRTEQQDTAAAAAAAAAEAPTTAAIFFQPSKPGLAGKLEEPSRGRRSHARLSKALSE